jgi:hypothetical protein
MRRRWLLTMKFTFTYDGPLWSQNTSGVFDKKWEMRETLHPQFERLWKVHPSLKSLPRKIEVIHPYQPWERYHTFSPDPLIAEPPLKDTEINLQAPVEISGVKFIPLVRFSYAITCSLSILFLRPEPPGNLIRPGGDIDNRIKTFLDALRVPPKNEAGNVANREPKPSGAVHCLLEDDSLITGLSVRTAQLLENVPSNHVRLVVDVDVSVTHPRIYNLIFR